MKRYYSIMVFVFWVVVAQAQNYHEVKALKGDGMFSLLRRYHLINASCNIDRFLELNGLKKDSPLLVGKKYKLPVLLYKYNGRSIRSTIGDNDINKAIAIKNYNELLKKEGIRKSDYRTSKILWVPYALLKCYSGPESAVKDDRKHNKPSKLPAVDSQIKDKKGKLKIYEPLFGKKWATVPIEDNRLRNRVFYILSGHGGPDPGAQCLKCNPVLCEDEYAYDVALRLARDLMQHGAIVHIIVKDKNDGIRDGKYLKCDRDEVSMTGRKIPLNQRKRLMQRSNDVNRLYSFYKKKKYIKSQTLVVIHVDSRHKDKRIDVFFSYAKGSKTGKKLARNIYKTFKMKYSKFQKGRGYKGSIGVRNWFVLNHTYPPAVFIELANIKNSRDHRRILLASNRQALANWIFEGLLKTYK